MKLLNSLWNLVLLSKEQLTKALSPSKKEQDPEVQEDDCCVSGECQCIGEEDTPQEEAPKEIELAYTAYVVDLPVTTPYELLPPRLSEPKKPAKKKKAVKKKKTVTKAKAKKPAPKKKAKAKK